MKTYKQFSEESLDEQYGAGIAIGVGAFLAGRQIGKILKKIFNNKKEHLKFYKEFTGTNTKYLYLNSLNIADEKIKDFKDISKYITDNYIQKYDYYPNTKEWHDNIRSFNNMMRREIQPYFDDIIKDARNYYGRWTSSEEKSDLILSEVDDLLKKFGYFKPTR